MAVSNLKTRAIRLLDSAGITLNGNKASDIQVLSDNFFQRVFAQGSLGLGESWMAGEWECERLDQCFERILRSHLESRITRSPWFLLRLLLQRLVSRQTRHQARFMARTHYDLGNDLFEAMLDRRMNYSCGYWKSARNLDEAQHDKLELACQKLQLKPHLRLLDIGCGFGAFARYAAETHDVAVQGITVSKEQLKYALNNCANLPVRLELKDYRDLSGQFDRIVSIGMFEHVGPLNYRDYFQIIHRCLQEEGLFLLQTIGTNHSTLAGDPWINKYIFPHGVLPSIQQIAKDSEDLFVMEDWQNLGTDYDLTLMAWHARFKASWETLKVHYDERFRRMWEYYLLSCAGMFRARTTQVWQIVFSKHGVRGGYRAPR